MTINKAIQSKLVWQINLSAMLNHVIVVETHDGHYRTGLLTKVEWAEVKIFKVTCQYPANLCFEDSMDSIPWQLIRSIRFPRAADKGGVGTVLS